MLATYLIPEDRVAELEATIARLAKRAAKLGTEPIALTVAAQPTEVPYRRVGEVGDSDTHWERCGAGDDVTALEREGLVRYRRFRSVDLVGSVPRLAGWEFVATIQHMEGEQGERLNMLRAVPGVAESLPVRFRTAGPENCDHCRRLIRTRRDTFVVRAVGEVVSHRLDGYMQVGRTCTQDFLGGVDPHAVAAALESLLEACCAAQAMAGDDSWSCGGGGRFSGGWSTREFLAVTAALVRRLGWVSRGQARDRDVTATADDVLRYLDPPSGFAARAEWRRFVEAHPVADQDRADADAALEYARAELGARDDLDDYLWNLRVACAQASVTTRTAGVTASLIAHHRREVARRVEAEARAARPSQHVGAVGERPRLRLTLASVRPVGGMYENYLHKFRTEGGDAVCWFASTLAQDVGGESVELRVGEAYWVRGTVKAHNDSERFGRETVLTRCTVLSDAQAADEDAKAARKAARDAKRAAKSATSAEPVPF